MSDAESGDSAEACVARANEARVAHEAELLGKANVVGVGVGLRQRRGKPTGKVAVVVLVQRKVARTRLAPEDVLPREIDGIPVDVQEVGEISTA